MEAVSTGIELVISSSQTNRSREGRVVADDKPFKFPFQVTNCDDQRGIMTMSLDVSSSNVVLLGVEALPQRPAEVREPTTKVLKGWGQIETVWLREEKPLEGGDGLV